MSRTSVKFGMFAVCLFSVLLLVTNVFAQETTGGLQGTVKDPSGAVVSNAAVELTGTSLVGKKTLTTDSSGYYRFANLPPGTYTVTVKAPTFSELKRDGIVIEVGHLPSLDLTLAVGAAGTVVEVSGAAPQIDVTTETTQTNITSDVLDDVPHEGRSFQSVIQFAPSASNEPLMGNNRMSNGTGSVSPGNGSNGNAYGYSVAGGSDSENSYLVEGQSTANIIGGYSHTNVPFDFIQEVQVKSNGIDAEHGGALGGVVNVVMKKGQNNYHGSVFMQFENQGLDGTPAVYQRYDPSSTPGTNGAFSDATNQQVQPIKPHTSDIFPGFTIGGPILKDKIYFFAGFNPELNDQERTVNYGPANGGEIPFSQNIQTYYTSARIDYAVTQKIRVFGSWLYQYQREAGENLPFSDLVGGLYNTSTGCYGSLASGDPTSPYYCAPGSGVAPSSYAHSLGYTAPNQTVNTGADWTLTPRLVSTTRFGYYFENYRDFGFPNGGNLYAWLNDSLGGTDTTGAPLPAALQQSTGYINAALDSNQTTRNANKAVQFDQDIAWFKSGWHGTHNFKFGYQLNRLSNNILQGFNEPYTQIQAGYSGNTASAYTPATPTGQANCAALLATQTAAGIAPADGLCQGQYGVATVYDFGTGGKATSYNHGFFAQDAWTIGRGLTLNLGLRVEREYLPGEGLSGPGVPSQPINFGWGDKIAPRLGAAWDVFKDGRMKVFGSYGVFNDIMKLNVAISSFGGQYWQNCAYAINTPTLSDINPVFNAAGRDCVGAAASSEANFGPGGGTGLTFLENQNLRAWPTTCATCSFSQEGVEPNLKPYRQHESTFGVDYQLGKRLSLEARWDRRRLDHAIEDSSIFNAATGAETFVIVNPGQAANRTFLGFCNFIYGAEAPSACVSGDGAYPPNNTIAAARSYDGMELRLTKATSNHWFGMFSYTYSHFRGNYTGLTSSDASDGGLGGRNSPNNSRAFDEPYFSWNDNGGSSSGLLPTDRPNKFKGYAYYELPEGKHMSTNFGIFQYFYQGSPVSTYVDAGYSYGGIGSGGWDVYPLNRGNWVNVSQDVNTGAITVGNEYVRRTPWYIQSDLNLQQNYKLGETKVISFSATFTNLFNQHSVTAYNDQIDTGAEQSFVSPGGNFIINGVSWYASAMTPWGTGSPASILSQNLNNSPVVGGPIQVSSQYGQPQFYQLSRNIRLGLKFTF
jgi:Carboxypeptidase regulatory-like domain/TonB dependent receptor